MKVRKHHDKKKHLNKITWNKHCGKKKKTQHWKTIHSSYIFYEKPISWYIFFFLKKKPYPCKPSPYPTPMMETITYHAVEGIDWKGLIS